MKDMNKTAQDLLEIRAMIKELEAEAESKTDTLKAAMIDRGQEVLEGDGWRCSWKNIESKRFDSKAFRTDHSDLYSQYSKPVTTTRFLISA